MGLSTVQGIVDQHQGFIEVSSRPGMGTTFAIFFPAAEGATPLEVQDQLVERLSGSEHILIVDDEKMLADLGAMMLSEAGYRVTTETDSRRALERIRHREEAFDLLLTDQTMPGMTGQELVCEIRKSAALMPVILCSGYSNRFSDQEIHDCGIDAYCTKPFEMTELLHSVRTVLDRHATAVRPTA